MYCHGQSQLLSSPKYMLQRWGNDTQKYTEEIDSLQWEVEVCVWKADTHDLREAHREMLQFLIYGFWSCPHETWGKFFLVMHDVHEMVSCIFTKEKKKKKHAYAQVVFLRTTSCLLKHHVTTNFTLSLV